jgi:cell division protease FtsH
MAEATPKVVGPLARSLDRLRKTIKIWRLKRRRAHAARRRTVSRKLTYALSILLLVLFGSYAWALDFTSPDAEGTELSLDELSALAQEKRVESAEFLDEDDLLTGSYVAKPLVDDTETTQGDAQGKQPKKEEAGRGPAAAPKDQRAEQREEPRGEQTAKELPSKAPKGAGTFWVTYPANGEAFGVLFDQLTTAGARVEVNPQTAKGAVGTIQTYLLPLLILATFFGLLFSAGRGGGTGIGEVLTFGSIGKKRQRKGFHAPVTFDDVAGADEAVAEMREVVDYLKDPERYADIGAVPPKGVLLFGPPGCGKTLIAKAVAGEAGVPFFSVAGAEFVESLVGVGAARVRDLFNRVRAVSPAIVFIDELDAAGRKRGHGGSSGGSDEREQTLNQLLVEMDGFDVSSGIVVVGATNRPDILDPALLRPGRFDRHITVDQPDLHGRQLILELHARTRPVADSVDFSYLAKRTPGFSGADLANVINEAALLTIREGKGAVETPELEEAIQRVLHGPKRRGRVLTSEERRRAAYHESGHAIVAAAVGNADEVHRVTILMRGRGLGLAAIRRESDALMMTRTQLYGQLVTAMSGMAAEELVLGEPSTGAEQDLEHATELARDIVGRFGMSPMLGRVRLLASDAEQFLSGDLGITQLSVQTHEEMDAEVRRLVDEAESDALRLLASNRQTLDALATRLEAEETLEGGELDGVLGQVRQEVVRMPAPEPGSEGNGARARGQAPRAARGRGQTSAD